MESDFETGASARVLVVGSGALGSALAETMVRAWVGGLTVVDRDVVRPVQGARAQVLVRLVQVAVARHQDAVPVLEERPRIHELAVAVHDETRVILDDGRHFEASGQLLRKRTRTDVDSEVTAACKRVEPHVPEGRREAATGVVADQQDRLLGKRIEHAVRPGLFRRQQGVNDAFVSFARHNRSRIESAPATNSAGQCTVTEPLRHPWFLRIRLV